MWDLNWIPRQKLTYTITTITTTILYYYYIITITCKSEKKRIMRYKLKILISNFKIKCAFFFGTDTSLPTKMYVFTEGVEMNC